MDDVESIPFVVKVRSFADRWYSAIAYRASHVRGRFGNLKAVSDLP